MSPWQVALLVAAAALGLTRPRDPAAAAGMLGTALAAVIEPAGVVGEDEPVRTFGLY